MSTLPKETLPVLYRIFLPEHQRPIIVRYPVQKQGIAGTANE